MNRKTMKKDELIPQMQEMINMGYSKQEIADKFGYSRANIYLMFNSGLLTNSKDFKSKISTKKNKENEKLAKVIIANGFNKPDNMTPNKYMRVIEYIVGYRNNELISFRKDKKYYIPLTDVDPRFTVKMRFDNYYNSNINDLANDYIKFGPRIVMGRLIIQQKATLDKLIEILDLKDLPEMRKEYISMLLKEKIESEKDLVSLLKIILNNKTDDYYFGSYDLPLERIFVEFLEYWYGNKETN